MIGALCTPDEPPDGPPGARSPCARAPNPARPSRLPVKPPDRPAAAPQDCRERALKAALRASFAAFLSGCNRPIASST